jgi:hypothetical protein
MKKKLTDTTKHPSFIRLTAFLRAAFGSEWRAEHPDVPVLALHERLFALTRPRGHIIYDSAAVIVTVSQLFVSIADVDPSLAYTSEDFSWLIAQINESDVQARFVIRALLAFASTECEYLTPLEAAARFGGTVNAWQKRTAAGPSPVRSRRGSSGSCPSLY